MFTVAGDVTGQELVDMTTTNLSDQPTLHTLWDSSGAGGVDIFS